MPQVSPKTARCIQTQQQATTLYPWPPMAGVPCFFLVRLKQRRNCGFGYIHEKLEFQNFPHSSFEVRVGGTAKKKLLPLLLPPSRFSSLPSPSPPLFPLPPPPFSLPPLLSLRKSVFIVGNHAVGSSGVHPPPCARWPGALRSWLAGHCPWVLVWTGACYWKGVGGRVCACFLLIHHHHVGVAPFCMRLCI